jgi:hypothetical protein
MITAAAPAFLPLQPSVTSGARLDPDRLRSGGCDLQQQVQGHDLQLP